MDFVVHKAEVPYHDAATPRIKAEPRVADKTLQKFRAIPADMVERVELVAVDVRRENRQIDVRPEIARGGLAPEVALFRKPVRMAGVCDAQNGTARRRVEARDLELGIAARRARTEIDALHRAAGHRHVERLSVLKLQQNIPQAVGNRGAGIYEVAVVPSAPASRIVAKVERIPGPHMPKGAFHMGPARLRIVRVLRLHGARKLREDFRREPHELGRIPEALEELPFLLLSESLRGPVQLFQAAGERGGLRPCAQPGARRVEEVREHVLVDAAVEIRRNRRQLVGIAEVLRNHIRQRTSARRLQPPYHAVCS